MDAEMELEAYGELTPIQKFFFGRNIFVTGATGLIGKVLVEKLLRCCPGIGTIYLLLRAKRGSNPEQRLEKILNCQLFEPIRKVFPAYREKVRVVVGDLEQERLGIGEDDWAEMQRKVSVVFHSAARVRFDDPVRLAAQTNLIATGNVLELCKELANLTVVVHVSTSYVHRDEDYTVPEHVTKCKVSPDQLLDALKWMDDEMLERITPQLLREKNNTYLLTKALAEHLVLEKRGDLPTAIVRPCNITPSWKDPFPGWVDTLQGPSGLFLAAAKGFLRTLYSVRELKLVLIPVDVVSNTMIVSAWHVATERPRDIFVVNCATDYEKSPLAGGELLEEVLSKRDTMPLTSMFRYPDFTVHYNYAAYLLHALVDQWIPALFLDIILFICTGKTLMVRLYKKIDYLFGIFLSVGLKPWITKMENYNTLTNKLTGKDSEMFFMDLECFDWHEYIDICIAGGRKFLAKEDPANIPYAKKKAKIWLYVTTVLKWCIISYIVYKLIPEGFLDRLYGNVEEQFYTLNSL